MVDNKCLQKFGQQKLQYTFPKVIDALNPNLASKLQREICEVGISATSCQNCIFSSCCQNFRIISVGFQNNASLTLFQFSEILYLLNELSKKLMIKWSFLLKKFLKLIPKINILDFHKKVIISKCKGKKLYFWMIAQSFELEVIEIIEHSCFGFLKLSLRKTEYCLGSFFYGKNISEEFKLI